MENYTELPNPEEYEVEEAEWEEINTENYAHYYYTHYYSPTKRAWSDYIGIVTLSLMIVCVALTVSILVLAKVDAVVMPEVPAVQSVER